MNKKKINIELQHQIKEYLEYYLKESLINSNDEAEQVIDMLSEPLKRQLMVESNKIVLNAIFKKNFS